MTCGACATSAVMQAVDGTPGGVVTHFPAVGRGPDEVFGAKVVESNAQHLQISQWSARPRTNLQLQHCCQPAHRLLHEAEMPLELAVGQGEGIIPDAHHTLQILGRRQWQHILNSSSMEEMKNNDVKRFC